MQQTCAFVLDSRPLNEYDRGYTLLTKEFGVIEAFAKSVRKSNAKLSGHLEPPSFSWIELVESHRGWQITSALEKNPHANILSYPPALRTALQAGFLMREFIPISHPDETIWNLWEDFLTQLSARAPSSAAVLRGVLAQFLIRLLSHLGFFPAPADIATDRRLRENLAMILRGAWLGGADATDPALWEAVRIVTKTARKLMV